LASRPNEVEVKVLTSLASVTETTDCPPNPCLPNITSLSALVGGLKVVRVKNLRLGRLKWAPRLGGIPRSTQYYHVGQNPALLTQSFLQVPLWPPSPECFGVINSDHQIAPTINFGN